MDAASRAELDVLRVRAYGPAADIATDPAALARLEELEREARGVPLPFWSDDSSLSRSSDEPDVRSSSDESRPPAPRDERSEGPIRSEPEDGPDPRVLRDERSEESDRVELRPTTTRWALIASGAALVVLAALVAPRLFSAGDPATTGGAEPEASVPVRVFEPAADSEVILRIPIDGSFGSYQDVPASGAEVVPALWEVRWADVLGEYYGFDLWIGEARVDEGERLCVVLATDEDGYVKSACAERTAWDRGGLYVSVPYTLIPPSRRPDGITPDQRLGFWWTPDDSVQVLQGGSRPRLAAG